MPLSIKEVLYKTRDVWHRSVPFTASGLIVNKRKLLTVSCFGLVMDKEPGDRTSGTL